MRLFRFSHTKAEAWVAAKAVRVARALAAEAAATRAAAEAAALAAASAFVVSSTAEAAAGGPPAASPVPAAAGTAAARAPPDARALRLALGLLREYLPARWVDAAHAQLRVPLEAPVALSGAGAAARAGGGLATTAPAVGLIDPSRYRGAGALVGAEGAGAKRKATTPAPAAEPTGKRAVAAAEAARHCKPMTSFFKPKA
jgi:hypothetical protein